MLIRHDWAGLMIWAAVPISLEDWSTANTAVVLWCATVPAAKLFYERLSLTAQSLP